jgi:hypothetical protein
MKISAIIALLLYNITIFALTDPIQLGIHDGKAKLIYPRQVIEGPDTNIYVYDEQDSYIKVFSPKGELLRIIGGPGEGPGFIKRPEMVNFGFTPTKLIYITEYFGGHRWITLLNPTGSFQQIIKPSLTNSMYGVERVFALKDHTYLIEFSLIGRSEKKGNFFFHSSPQTIFHMDAKGNIISKIKETCFFTRISYLKRGADIGIPFCPSNFWIPYDKNSILFTDGMDNKLLVISFNGKIIREINTKLPEVPLVTKKDLKSWRIDIKDRYCLTSSGKEWYERFGKVIEEYKDPIYEKKPYIQSMQLTPEGNIFITSIPITGNTNRNFWLLNSEGKILAFSIYNIYQLKISPHFFFVKRFDADENMLVYCYKRDKDELSDFFKLNEKLKR